MGKAWHALIADHCAGWNGGRGEPFGRVQADHILIGPAVVNRDTVTVKPDLGRGPDVKTAKTTY